MKQLVVVGLIGLRECVGCRMRRAGIDECGNRSERADSRSAGARARAAHRHVPPTHGDSRQPRNRTPERRRELAAQ